MKILFYPRLALSGIQKNRQLYLPYFLTCSGMVMMFYLLCFLSYSKGVSGMALSAFIASRPPIFFIHLNTFPQI